MRPGFSEVLLMEQSIAELIFTRMTIEGYNVRVCRLYRDPQL